MRQAVQVVVLEHSEHPCGHALHSWIGFVASMKKPFVTLQSHVGLLKSKLVRQAVQVLESEHDRHPCGHALHSWIGFVVSMKNPFVISQSHVGLLRL